MLLFEKYDVTNKLFKGMANVQPQPELFDVTNVASMYYRDNVLDGEKLTEDVFREFPTLSPPYKFSWYEFRISNAIRESILRNLYNVGSQEDDHSRFLRRTYPEGFGVLLTTRKISEEDSLRAMWDDPIQDWVPGLFYEDGTGGSGKETIRNLLSSKVTIEKPPRWMMFFSLNAFLDFGGKKKDAPLVGMMTCYLDAKGKYIPNTIRMLVSETNNVGNLFMTDAVRVCSPVYYAITLLHCKNIKTVANQPNAKVNKKRLRRGKEPLVIYKTLNIHPNLSGNSGAGSKESDIELRQHIRRGHWRLYTPQRPMFGRQGLHGLFWIEDTVVNPENEYKVEKEYKVWPE